MGIYEELKARGSLQTKWNTGCKKQVLPRTCFYVGDFTMSGNAAFPLVLTGISVLFALLSVREVETKDLM